MSGRGGPNRGGGGGRYSGNRGGGGGGRSNSRGGRGRSGGRGGGRGHQGGGSRGSLNVCANFAKGSCSHGPNCTFAHVVTLHRTLVASSPLPNQNGYNNNQQVVMAPVKSVAIWENNGIQIFTGSEDGYWRLWNTGNFSKAAEQNMNGPVACLKVVSNHLFCGFAGAAKAVPDGKAGQVHVWNLASPTTPPMELHMSEPWHQFAHNQSVTCLEIIDNAGSPRIISGSADGTIRVWSLQNTKFVLEKSLPGHAGEVTSLCMIPGGSILWSSSMDGTLRIWDLSKPDATACQHCISRETPPPGAANNPQAGPVGGHTDGITALLPFSMNSGNFLLSGSLDGFIKVWDAATGNCVQSENNGDSVVTMAVADSTSGKVLMVGGQSGNISCRTILPTSKFQSLSLIFVLSARFALGHNGDVFSIAAGPSNTFYTGGNDGQVLVWQFTGDLGLQ